jgi:hypothetical protein
MSKLAAQKATAQAVIDGYNAWNMDKILAYRTPDCTQQVLPASLGRPIMNNTQYRERFSQMLPCFRNFKVTHTEVCLGVQAINTASGYCSHRGA